MLRKLIKRFNCNHDYYTLSKRSYIDVFMGMIVTVRRKKCRKCGKKKTFKDN